MHQNRFISSSATAFSLLALTGALWGPDSAGLRQGALASTAAPTANPLETLVLTGVVRDFREHAVEGGHPDFEKQPDHGFGRYSGNVATELGDDGKPIWTGGGRKVSQQWRDSQHRQICHALFDSSRGDVEGSWGNESTGAVQGAESFSKWFRDEPGVNMSAPLSLTFVRQADGSYVFDDKLDPVYSTRGGFFPIDDQLFGNSAGSPKHNYHFTFELNTRFTYQAADEQMFKFIGDDDVYVFIDGKLVIDLGGVHAAHDQYVDLNRLGLVDGESYTLDFFFAERHRTQSNFRIQTNLLLENQMTIPAINASFD